MSPLRVREGPGYFRAVHPNVVQCSAVQYTSVVATSVVVSCVYVRVYVCGCGCVRACEEESMHVVSSGGGDCRLDMAAASVVNPGWKMYSAAG